MTSQADGRWASVATSWGTDEEPEPARPRRVGYRASSLLALTAGAAGEAAIRLTDASPRMTTVWDGVRVPFLALVALAVAQVPVARRRVTPTATLRPERSELARHLDRRSRP